MSEEIRPSGEPGRLGRAKQRVVSEANARVEQIRTAADTAARGLNKATVFSVGAAVVAWGVLFGVRLGSGPSWVMAGIVVLIVLLIPAASLWYLRRQLRFVATLPDQISELFEKAASTTDAEEVRERFATLSDKEGLRLALAVGALVRWARDHVDVPAMAGTGQHLTRVVTTVPLATGLGVVGTVAVVLLIPVFAISSAVLALIG